MLALTRLAVRRPVAVTVVAAALVVLGWRAWGTLSLDLLPDLESPTIVVSIRSGDRPPGEMERVYGEQVEQRLFAVRGIRRIEQVARTGRLIATVVFHWDADMDFAVVDVEKSIGPIRSDPDVDEVFVRHFDPRQAPVLNLGLVPHDDGPDLAELRLAARRQIAIALERLEGVAEARVTGGREREVRVEVDRYRLEAFGATLAELESRLQQANLDLSAGTLEDGDRVFLVRGIARFREPRDIERVVLGYREDAAGHRVPVLVRDVADVALADRDITHLVRVDGVEGIGIAIYKEAGANTVAVSRTVRAALDGLTGDLPGVDLRVVTDEAALVEDALADVEGAALLGIALAMLVLLVFLRSAGPTLVVAVAVPVSLLTTLFLMHFGGHGLNIMTLGGLALGAGMLVDNAIVVVESIFRRLGHGDAAPEAAAAGTADVAGAIIASTLTTCAVFGPIVFVRGLAARLVTGLAFSVVVSLLASLVVATLLIPALAGWLLPRRAPRVPDPGIGAVERLVGRLLRRPFIVLCVALLAVAAAVIGLRGLGSELLPPSDPRQFSVRLVGDPGMRVESTEQLAAVVEDVLRRASGDDLRAMMAEIGRLPEDDRLIREEQTEENTARIVVRLAAGGRRAQQVVSAAAPIVAAMKGFEASWEVGSSSLARALGTSGPPIAVEILGRSLDELREGASRMRDELATSDVLWNVRSSFEGGPPELRLRLDRALADGLGVDLGTVSAALEAALDGRTATVMSTGDEERDVVLRLPRVRAERLLDLQVTSTTGARVTVGDIATLEQAAGAREIFRNDQRRVARVTARIAPDAEYPEARAAAEAALAAVELPPGMRARLTGEEAERRQTFDELRFAGLLALLLVFMVLAGTFESLVHPFTITLAVPLSLVGVAAVLVPLGRPIGVMEALGVIVLAGVAVNDAILLVDAARRAMRDGLDTAAALARAAGERLRPILMTTITTVLALAPLAVGGGEAARLRSPLALTIIGGIVASTLASLFVIPCVFLVIERLRPGRAGRA